MKPIATLNHRQNEHIDGLLHQETACTVHGYATGVWNGILGRRIVNCAMCRGWMSDGMAIDSLTGVLLIVPLADLTVKLTGS